MYISVILQVHSFFIFTTPRQMFVVSAFLFGNVNFPFTFYWRGVCVTIEVKGSHIEKAELEFAVSYIALQSIRERREKFIFFSISAPHMRFVREFIRAFRKKKKNNPKIKITALHYNS